MSAPALPIDHYGTALRNLDKFASKAYLHALSCAQPSPPRPGLSLALMLRKIKEPLPFLLFIFRRKILIPA
jgi:hypothetical protein